MNKILKPYTIIPPELYVQRDADKQVRNIIRDMGRPGYVLVSRQMGKTNLLLNAKRKYETISDVFLYIDLSNSFPDARSCFESIIDVAIETYPEKFCEVSNVIYDRRIHLKDTPAHKQHTNELRLLLKALNGGKIIIILDEIDALTKTDYSDQIFSQIRSSYFASRVNYNEFYGLTYLLSGVVEPNEIIKDPKISPFNIGQKIYLNDFTREEYERFLMISGIKLSDESVSRIFYWTNGNPRMMWDVCSEVENKLMQEDVNVDMIDKLVTELYLTTYDKPPIDNIREIVKKDRDIRNAIVEIEFKKGKEVSDKIKSKLYLAGIINYHEDDICIKNEIIRRSLSYEWIRAIEEEDKGLIKIAIEEYQKFKYAKALEAFKKYLSADEFVDNVDKHHYYYIMGHCAFVLKDYEGALGYFNNAKFNVDDEAIWYYTVLVQRGLTYFYLNSIEKSLQCFKKVISNCKKDEIYAKALLDYGSIALQSDVETHKDEAIQIFEKIIDETAFEKEKIKQEFIEELKTIAHFNLAQTFDNIHQQSKVVENYRKAISFSKDIVKPKIILALLEVTTEANEKITLINQLLDLVSTGKVRPTDEELEASMDFSYSVFRGIILYLYKNYYNDYFELILSQINILGEKPLAQHFYEIAVFAIDSKDDFSVAIELLNDANIYLEKEGLSVDKKIAYNINKLLSYFNDTGASLDVRLKYFANFKSDRADSVDYIDLRIFEKYIFQLTEQRKYHDALKYVELINSVKQFALVNPEEYITVDHLELNLYAYLNQKETAINKARDILKFINEYDSIKHVSNYVHLEDVDIIRKNAEVVLDSFTAVPIAMSLGKVYRRNEKIKVRYNNGSIVFKKYKMVKEDIENGECVIIK
ncbi:MAG: hypothetical protein HGB23_02865 [Chlorobiaceae bacterium]|nr:hypothetical protein [Chlorobiaceae bacterium]